MGPHNITMGCWERSLNLSLPVQLFKHPGIIMRTHITRFQRWGMLCSLSSKVFSVNVQNIPWIYAPCFIQHPSQNTRLSAFVSHSLILLLNYCIYRIPKCHWLRKESEILWKNQWKNRVTIWRILWNLWFCSQAIRGTGLQELKRTRCIAPWIRCMSAKGGVRLSSWNAWDILTSYRKAFGEIQYNSLKGLQKIL